MAAVAGTTRIGHPAIIWPVSDKARITDTCSVNSINAARTEVSPSSPAILTYLISPACAPNISSSISGVTDESRFATYTVRRISSSFVSSVESRPFPRPALAAFNSAVRSSGIMPSGTGRTTSARSIKTVFDKCRATPTFSGSSNFTKQTRGLPVISASG